MDKLPLIAEVSVAYAGFTSIFLIFARRDGRFEVQDSLRIEAIFMASFMCLFMSLVPLALSHAPLSETMVYRIAAAIAFFVNALLIVYFGRKQFSLSPESQQKLGTFNRRYSWCVGTMTIVALGIIVLDILPQLTEFLYLTVLVLYLGMPTSHFVTIAKQRLA